MMETWSQWWRSVNASNILVSASSSSSLEPTVCLRYMQTHVRPLHTLVLRFTSLNYLRVLVLRWAIPRQAIFGATSSTVGPCNILEETVTRKWFQWAIQLSHSILNGLRRNVGPRSHVASLPSRSVDIHRMNLFEYFESLHIFELEDLIVSNMLEYNLLFVQYSTASSGNSLAINRRCCS